MSGQFWFTVALSLVLGYFTTGYFSLNNWVWSPTRDDNQLYFVSYTTGWVIVLNAVFWIGQYMI